MFLTWDVMGGHHKDHDDGNSSYLRSSPSVMGALAVLNCTNIFKLVNICNSDTLS